MENYVKDKNVEEALSRDKIPIPDLPWDFLWMQVNGGSKMTNLLSYAIKAFKEGGKAMVWSASGGAIGKAISCAEIVKRRHKNIHQITKICYRKVEEFWKPLIDNMDPLVVVREVPTIHILLSKDPLNTNEPGYQAPNNANTFWKSDDTPDRGKRSGKPVRKSKTTLINPSEFAALGLRSGRLNRSRKRGPGGDQQPGKSGAGSSSSGTTLPGKPKDQDRAT